jgi:hypothetical protein
MANLALLVTRVRAFTMTKVDRSNSPDDGDVQNDNRSGHGSYAIYAQAKRTTGCLAYARMLQP